MIEKCCGGAKKCGALSDKKEGNKNKCNKNNNITSSY
jgi:hypothetical protein